MIASVNTRACHVRKASLIERAGGYIAHSTGLRIWFGMASIAANRCFEAPCWPIASNQPVAPKEVKDKFVSQCGPIVRDNVPIKYREWKGKPSNPYVVLDLVKDQLWNDVLKHFALP
jgi:hypothetical protein